MDEHNLEIVRKQFIEGQLKPGSIISELLANLPPKDIISVKQKAAEGMMGLELEQLYMQQRFKFSSLDIWNFIQTVKEFEEKSQKPFSRWVAEGVFNTASGNIKITSKSGCITMPAFFCFLGLIGFSIIICIL